MMGRKGKRAALYLRVSTDGQTTENQRLELERTAEARGWEIVATYKDQGISGAKFGKDRPQLEQLRKDAARGKFDLVLSWSIDRIGRSTAQVSAFMEEMEEIGVGQFYLHQGIDTNTVGGRAMVQMAAVFAEFERGMIRERVKSGIARARSKGTKSGKAIGRPKVDGKTEAAILALRKKKMGFVKIAKQLGVGVSTVQRVVAS
jgi:DNA invertase Pin-like site-specific DNA recombinase